MIDEYTYNHAFVIIGQSKVVLLQQVEVLGHLIQQIFTLVIFLRE